MNRLIKSSLVLLMVCLFSNTQAQVEKEKREALNEDWFIGFDYGIQMSGIKSEDFVSSNYSPVYKLSVGKWVSKSIAITLGYQGRYFRTIADEIRYTYNFYSVEAILDVRNFFSKEIKERPYTILLHAGPGLFFHKVYGRSNIHGNIGASNLFKLSKKIRLKLDISAIIGWDIYQGDQDILPNTSIGILYEF